MDDKRLVLEVEAQVKRAIDIKAATDGVSIRDLVEPILKRAFKKEIEALNEKSI